MTALEEWKNDFKGYINKLLIPNYNYKRIMEYIDEVPNETKWIPVSEGLPKENGWYQCTVIFYNSLQTMELFYKNGKWLDNRRIDMFNTYDIYGYGNTKEKHKLSYQELFSEFDWTENVIAWKPLSGPYVSYIDDGKIAESEE